MHQNKLRIVQIIDRLNIGGAERILVILSNILNANGHIVKVITTVNPGPLVKQLNAGIKYKNLNRKWKWNPYTMYKLIKETKGYHVIHVHSSHNLRYLFLAGKLFGLHGRIFYQEHHGARIEKKANLVQRFIYRRTLFIATSTKIAVWAMQELKIKASKVHVLPNIVMKEKVQAVSKKNDETIKLIVVSNFVPVKNLTFAIKIFKEFLNRNENSLLTIVGKKADWDYYLSVQKFVEDYKLTDKVSFVHDCIDIQQLLPGYTLALHTSFSESGPLVLIEYMAQTLPLFHLR